MRVMRETGRRTQGAEEERASIYWLDAVIAQTGGDTLEPDAVPESIWADQQ